MIEQIPEVIEWYEERIGRKLTQAERACIRYQCVIMQSEKPEIKDLKKLGICIDGLEYGGLESEKNNNCNLTTCRYNQSNKCTNEEKRKECVEVSKRVLCLKGNDNANRK